MLADLQVGVMLCEALQYCMLSYKLTCIDICSAGKQAVAVAQSILVLWLPSCGVT